MDTVDEGEGGRVGRLLEPGEERRAFETRR
jgi:hypothetical protein